MGQTKTPLLCRSGSIPSQPKHKTLSSSDPISASSSLVEYETHHPYLSIYHQPCCWKKWGLKPTRFAFILDSSGKKPDLTIQTYFIDHFFKALLSTVLALLSEHKISCVKLVRKLIPSILDDFVKPQGENV